MGNNETFYPIIGAEQFYEVNKVGVVRSLDRYIPTKTGKLMLKKGMIIKPQMNSSGYYCFNISIPENYRIETLHRIVAKLFIPNPDNLPEVNHINGIRADNSLSNLEWVNHQQNIKHAYSYGKTIHNRKLDYDAVLDIYHNTMLFGVNYKREGKYTLREMEQKYNISRSQISMIIRQKSYLEITSKFEYIPIINISKKN